jgi:hypothetical protein
MLISQNKHHFLHFKVSKTLQQDFLLRKKIKQLMSNVVPKCPEQASMAAGTCVQPIAIKLSRIVTWDENHGLQSLLCH